LRSQSLRCNTAKVVSSKYWLHYTFALFSSIKSKRTHHENMKQGGRAISARTATKLSPDIMGGVQGPAVPYTVNQIDEEKQQTSTTGRRNGAAARSEETLALKSLTGQTLSRVVVLCALWRQWWVGGRTGRLIRYHRHLFWIEVSGRPAIVSTLWGFAAGNAALKTLKIATHRATPCPRPRTSKQPLPPPIRNTQPQQLTLAVDSKKAVAGGKRAHQHRRGAACEGAQRVAPQLLPAMFAWCVRSSR